MRWFPSAVAIACLLPLVSTAAPSAPPIDDLLPPEAPEGSADLLLRLAGQIMDVFPFLAGLVCFILLMLLHYWRARSLADGWDGRPAGWLRYWAVPCAASVVVYFGLCAGILLYGISANPEFKSFVSSNFDPSHVVVWILVGTLIAVLPALFKLVAPAAPRE